MALAAVDDSFLTVAAREGSLAAPLATLNLMPEDSASARTVKLGSTDISKIHGGIE